MRTFLSYVHQPGSVVGFTGLMGSGKTGSMTLCALRQQRAGYRVRANYSTSFAERVTSADQLYCDGTCIVVDELQLSVNARSFASRFNIDFSAWMELHIRKRFNIFMFTTQDIDMVDVNVRRLMAYLVDCELRFVRGSKYSRVRVFQNMRFGRFSLVQDFLYPQSWLGGGYYDTHDREVLLDGPAEKPSRRR